MLGLYIHIPFCAAICNYCNFNRGLLVPAQKQEYVRVLAEEIRTCQHAGAREAETIYFGGGTPSLLEPAEIASLIDACRDAFLIADDAEITVEANPESATQSWLSAVRAAGVNRVSFGVQSLRDAELQRLSRLHTASRARDVVREARAASFDNVSLDLMMWLPQQQPEHWFESVDRAIDLHPDHLSLYLLEVYPNAPLRDEMARARWSQAPDEDAVEMYTGAMDRLARAGLAQYEISNVARPGRESRHNMKYWTDGEWFGFGCGAHSTVGGVRWKNTPATDEYMARVKSGATVRQDVRPLSEEQQLGDALFMGLRLTRGVDLVAVGRRYGVDVLARYGNALAPFIDEGLAVLAGGTLRLTRPGMLLANEVMEVFV